MGFKTALEWAEAQNTPITAEEINATNWEPAVEVNIELYEYLQTVTSGEALVLIERFPDRGFEAWRQLLQRHNPVGGRFELRSLINLLNGQSPCKTLDEVPAAADRLEKEIRGYESRSNMKFPEEFKLPLLTHILPPKDREEIERKFGYGEKDYFKVLDSIINYSNEKRVIGEQERGTRPMDLDSLGQERQPDRQPEPCGHQKEEEYTDEQWAEFEAEEELYYMGKKGYGKGGKKGKKGGKKGGKGGWYPQPWYPTPKGGKALGKGDQKGNNNTEKECWWCLKKGHFKRDCPDWWAGKPKATVAGGAGSLEDWEEEDDDAGQCDDEGVDTLDDVYAELDKWDNEDFEAVDESEEEMLETPLQRLPLIVSMANTPSSSDRGQSLTEKIREEQKEMAKMLLETGASPAAPCGAVKEIGHSLMESRAHTLSRLTRLSVPKLQNKFQVLMEETMEDCDDDEIIDDEVGETEPVKVSPANEVINKNRNQSKKAKTKAKVEAEQVSATDERRGGRWHKAKKSLHNAGSQTEGGVASENKDAGSQTNVSLKEKQNNILWTPTVLESVVDYAIIDEDEDEEDDEKEDEHVGIGNMVDDIDNIEEEDTPENLPEMKRFQIDREVTPHGRRSQNFKIEKM